MVQMQAERARCLPAPTRPHPQTDRHTRTPAACGATASGHTERRNKAAAEKKKSFCTACCATHCWLPPDSTAVAHGRRPVQSSKSGSVLLILQRPLHVQPHQRQSGPLSSMHVHRAVSVWAERRNCVPATMSAARPARARSWERRERGGWRCECAPR